MSDLQKAFEGLRHNREPEPLGTQVVHAIQHPRGMGGGQSKAIGREGLRIAPAPVESTAKSKDPDYTPVKVFLRRDTHKAAGRKWEDAERGDFSDLVEHLLRSYLDT